MNIIDQFIFASNRFGIINFKERTGVTKFKKVSLAIVVISLFISTIQWSRLVT